jgi:hypothetical protein
MEKVAGRAVRVASLCVSFLFRYWRFKSASLMDLVRGGRAVVAMVFVCLGGGRGSGRGS